MDSVVSVKDLTKVYPRPKVTALAGVSFSIPRGCCFGILGPNGAGKSTLLETLQGIRSPTSGSVMLFGLSYTTHEMDIRRRIGGILQENGLYSRMKVREALELFASFYAAPLAIAEMLACLRLTEVAERYLIHLSGGQRQRVFLGTALVGRPEILFLDEPTTGLDPASRADFWAVVKELRHQGSTVVLTTHYMEEAQALCDTLLMIDRGKVLEEGSPGEVIARVAQAAASPYFPSQPTLNDVFLVLTGRRPE